MLAIELRRKSVLELLRIEEESRAELFALRFQAAMGNLEKPSRIRELKILIARVLTTLTEKQYAGEKIDRNIKIDLSKTFKTIEKDTKKLIKSRKEQAKKLLEEQSSKSKINDDFFENLESNVDNNFSNSSITKEKLSLPENVNSEAISTIKVEQVDSKINTNLNKSKLVNIQTEVKPVNTKVETKQTIVKTEVKPVIETKKSVIKTEVKSVNTKVETKQTIAKTEVKPVVETKKSVIKTEVKPVVETKKSVIKTEVKPVVETKKTIIKTEVKPVIESKKSVIKTEVKPVNTKVETKKSVIKTEVKPVDTKVETKQVILKNEKLNVKKVEKNNLKEIDSVYVDLSKLLSSEVISKLEKWKKENHLINLDIKKIKNSFSNIFAPLKADNQVFDVAKRLKDNLLIEEAKYFIDIIENKLN